MISESLCRARNIFEVEVTSPASFLPEVNWNHSCPVLGASESLSDGPVIRQQRNCFGFSRFGMRIGEGYHWVCRRTGVIRGISERVCSGGWWDSSLPSGRWEAESGYLRTISSFPPTGSWGKPLYSLPSLRSLSFCHRLLPIVSDKKEMPSWDSLIKLWWWGAPLSDGPG